MESQEVRWIQRANSFERALERLRAAVKLAEQRELSDLEAQGLIQGFEYTHELAWKTLKNFLEAQGIVNLYGSRDTTRTAFRNGLIENGEVWMDMVDKRNLTSHTYDEEVAAEVVRTIRNTYFAEFEKLLARLQQLKSEGNL
ncbi:nucleotidyltransferase [Candidatus Poribacteria bacterium]|nr:nucleotidyltransferase [Candidatus Poribacteria bacterium]MYG07535.1 nucleotidyltransferase [Candidatus Poribacteria bacterium]MYK25285.1 nucleotidyltransferase [Candidatus Poribacteria bacterium]